MFGFCLLLGLNSEKVCTQPAVQAGFQGKVMKLERDIVRCDMWGISWSLVMFVTWKCGEVQSWRVSKIPWTRIFFNGHNSTLLEMQQLLEKKTFFVRNLFPDKHAPSRTTVQCCVMVDIYLCSYPNVFALRCRSPVLCSVGHLCFMSNAVMVVALNVVQCSDV